jgi:hypothetical protein
MISEKYKTRGLHKMTRVQLYTCLTEHVSFCYIMVFFAKRYRISHGHRSDMAPYVDPDTGLRQCRKTKTGEAEDLYPIMARYTNLHHTMRTMFVSMEHIMILQTTSAETLSTRASLLMDGMLSGGVDGVLQVLQKERVKQEAERATQQQGGLLLQKWAKQETMLMPANEETGGAQQETMLMPANEEMDSACQVVGTRKRKLCLAMTDVSNVFPDYETLCAGVNLRVCAFRPELAPAPVCTDTAVVSNHIRYGRPEQASAKPLLVPTAPVTPRGIYDRTTRHPLIH